jgi:hypothetical protein
MKIANATSQDTGRSVCFSLDHVTGMECSDKGTIVYLTGGWELVLRDDFVQLSKQWKVYADMPQRSPEIADRRCDEHRENPVVEVYCQHDRHAPPPSETHR